MSSLFSAIFGSFDWFIRIVKLNMIWLLTSIAGLLLFTIFPATLAAYEVTNQWAKGNVEVPIWKTFWQALKMRFWRAQLVGCLLALAFLIIGIDFWFFKDFENILIKSVVFFVLFTLLLCLITIALHIFSITAAYNQGLKASMKITLFSGLAFIHWTVISFLGVMGILFVTYLFPGAFVFLTSGACMLWTTCITEIIQRKLENKYEKLNSVVEQ